MGSPKEDVEIAIIFPFVTVFLFLLLWKYAVGKLSHCILGLSDRLINEIVITFVHLASLQRMSPYEAQFIPTPLSTEITLLFSASYYLKTAFVSDTKTDISYNLMVFITILDIVSFKKGGDTTLYLLFLIEAPDFLSVYFVPFLKSEACYDIIYTVFYIFLKIFLLGHLLYKSIMNDKVSEDIKMNMFIIYLYCVICLPALLLSVYNAKLDNPMTGLPQLSRRKLEPEPAKIPRRRSYSRGRRR